MIPSYAPELVSRSKDLRYVYNNAEGLKGAAKKAAQRDMLMEAVDTFRQIRVALGLSAPEDKEYSLGEIETTMNLALARYAAGEDGETTRAMLHYELLDTTFIVIAKRHDGVKFADPIPYQQWLDSKPGHLQADLSQKGLSLPAAPTGAQLDRMASFLRLNVSDGVDIHENVVLERAFIHVCEDIHEGVKSTLVKVVYGDELEGLVFGSADGKMRIRSRFKAHLPLSAYTALELILIFAAIFAPFCALAFVRAAC